MVNVIPVGVTVGAAAALGFLGPVLVLPRSIGGFVANVTVEEQHEDDLVITEHPVEQGAEVADHAYKRPARVTIRTGFSNSSLQALANPNYVQQVYGQFLALQSSRVPFDVLTGKRKYNNMLIQQLRVTTDEKTENALMMTVECKEIILTSTQTVSVPATSQAKPELTQPPVQRGVVQITPAPNYKP